MSHPLNKPVETIQEALSRKYPEATPTPCNECPWRRNAAPGWLGPYSADEWLEIAHSEAPIACHKTVGRQGWQEKSRQCQGAAIFRANVAKQPMNPTMAQGPRDTQQVFRSNAEFKDHHENELQRRIERTKI